MKKTVYEIVKRELPRPIKDEENKISNYQIRAPLSLDDLGFVELNIRFRSGLEKRYILKLILEKVDFIN